MSSTSTKQNGHFFQMITQMSFIFKVLFVLVQISEEITLHFVQKQMRPKLMDLGNLIEII